MNTAQSNNATTTSVKLHRLFGFLNTLWLVIRPCVPKHVGWRIYDFTVSNMVHLLVNKDVKGKSKVFTLQAWGGPWGSGRLRLSDFLDFRRYEGGKVVTLMHRPPLPPGVFWYSFLEVELTPGHMGPSVATEKIPNDTTGDRSQDSPTSTIVYCQKCTVWTTPYQSILQFRTKQFNKWISNFHDLVQQIRLMVSMVT
jgi:hypothetical protein